MPGKNPLYKFNLYAAMFSKRTKNLMPKLFAGAVLAALLLPACESSQKKLNRRLETAISRYMEANTGADVKVDSVCILHIDSLSDYHYVLFVEKPIAENYAEELNVRYNSYPEDGDVVALEQRQRIADRITLLINRMETMDRQLTEGTLDSTNLKCFFVATRIYLRKGDKPLEPEYYGFPVTPDFQVLESDAIPDEDGL